MKVHKALKLLESEHSLLDDSYLEAVDILKEVQNAIVFLALLAEKRDMWLHREINKRG